MKVRKISDTQGRPAVAALHAPTGAWIDLADATNRFAPNEDYPFTRDVLAFLASRERGRDLAHAMLERSVDEGTSNVSPRPQMALEVKSLRCFLGWEQHWVDAAHIMVKKNLPAAVPAIRLYETLTRRTFPALQACPSFSDHPVYYTGNHLSILPDGVSVRWPHYSSQLDYELEYAMIIDRAVLDAGEAQGAKAIGGFVVFNDFSARDVQWEEQRRGSFGPVVKTKTFASSMSAVITTADEVLPHIDNLAASVTVDGEVWATTSTAGQRYSPGELVAYASRAEDLHPGELMTSGTLPSGSGLELDRWIRPGNTVTLAIDSIGEVSNLIESPSPATTADSRDQELTNSAPRLRRQTA